MAKRNRHPFEGDLKRGKEGGKYRLWTGHGGEWVYRRSHKFDPWANQITRTRAVYLPIRPLVCVGRVPSLAFANAVIARRTGRRVVVRLLNSRGLKLDEPGRVPPAVVT